MRDIPTAPYISILHRKHAKYINDNVKEEDLSFGLQPLLIAIYDHQGIIQEQLAQIFHLNESTITRNLKKLEDRGFIKRIPDKRTKRIEITGKGVEAAKKVMEYDERWDLKIIEIIGENEYENFKNTLKTISEAIK